MDLFEEKMESLKAQLMEQFEKSDDLKNQIIANLKKFKINGFHSELRQLDKWSHERPV